MQNECGAQEKTFTVHSPGDIASTYTIQMGDELIVAALSLFYPDLLKITGPKNTITQKPNPGDPDDPFDENYLRETSVSALSPCKTLIDITVSLNTSEN